MGEDWGKLIVAKGIKKLPKVQNIAQSGQIARDTQLSRIRLIHTAAASCEFFFSNAASCEFFFSDAASCVIFFL